MRLGGGDIREEELVKDISPRTKTELYRGTPEHNLESLKKKDEFDENVGRIRLTHPSF